MRRFQLRNTPAAASAAAATLSIESMNIDQILQGRQVLSVEEEVVALAAADEMANQVEQDVAETVRVEDVTDVMLNVADTVETVQDITPEQAMLVDTVSEMAVAGTDADPDSVIETAEPLLAGTPEEKAVALESFVENMRARAAEIWEKIKKFCLEIWNTIVGFFKQIFMAAPRLLARVKVLRDAVDALKKKGTPTKKVESFAVLVGTNSISYSDYQVRDAKELGKGISEIAALAKYAYGAFLKDAQYQAEAVATELKKFDPHAAAEHLKKVATTLPKNNFTNVPTSPATGYMGCFDVHTVRLDKSRIKDLSDAQIAGALRNSGVKLVARTGSAASFNTKNAFAVMSPEEMTSTLSAVENLVKQVIAYEGSSQSKAIEKARADLVEGGNHASAALGKLEGKDDAGKMERAYALDVMKSLMNFNTTITRWVSDLPMPVMKKIYNTSRTSLVLVEKSIGSYA